MKLRMYLKNSTLKITYCIFVIFLVNIVLINSEPINASFIDILYMNFLIFVITIIFTAVDYRRWKSSYEDIWTAVKERQDITLSLPHMEYYFELQLIKDIIKLKDIEADNKADEIRAQLEEVNDYITKWVHEIKMPIAVCELIADKMEETDISEELRLELDRIKFLINQVLYTSRASGYAEDLQVREITIGRIVKDVVKRNVSFFMAKNIELKLGNIDFNVHTDEKWLAYILDQLINNSCKYVNAGGIIEIYGEEDRKTVRLHIKDNGIGIMEKDIKRIFDKSFTGENGRHVTKSTGMGLYLSKKMANRLSHDMQVNSKVGEGTEFIISFYKLSDYFKVT